MSIINATVGGEVGKICYRAREIVTFQSMAFIQRNGLATWLLGLWYTKREYHRASAEFRVGYTLVINDHSLQKRVE